MGPDKLLVAATWSKSAEENFIQNQCWESWKKVFSSTSGFESQGQFEKTKQNKQKTT